MLKSKKHIPCSNIGNDQLEVLHEIAKLQMGLGLDFDSKIMDRARKRAQERYDSTQKRIKEAEHKLNHLEAELMHQAIDEVLRSNININSVIKKIDSDSEKKRLEAEISNLQKEPRMLTKTDFDYVVSDFVKRGLIHKKASLTTLTSKGVRLLGRGFLNQILLKLAKKGVGPHKIEEIGYGAGFASTVRPYEAYDPYERISIEDTLIAFLERGGSDLSLEDFKVFNAIHATDIQFGILVDQSASMNRDGKIEAAIETALALHELTISKFPEDKIRLFAFSEEAKEVDPWGLPAIEFAMGYTNIRAALQAYRFSVIHQSGNKQAHLITDSAPNFENGKYVGSEKALIGVLNEARMYRSSGIILNIVMLDDDHRLQDIAKTIARKNLGRVFFTRPSELGEALVEDYLETKRKFIRF